MCAKVKLFACLFQRVFFWLLALLSHPITYDCEFSLDVRAHLNVIVKNYEEIEFDVRVFRVFGVSVRRSEASEL